MSTTNIHGLSRDIPEDIKRSVRQECHNGCVICGRFPYIYEHFDPEYKDAKTHAVEGIALLCPGCHQEKTSRRISTEQVRQRRLKPFNEGKDAVWTTRLGPGELRLRIGDIDVSGPALGISINGVRILGVKAPSVSDGDWLISAFLCDRQGRGALLCRDNEVVVGYGLWDWTLEGTDLVIRAGPREIVAHVSFDAKNMLLDFKRIEMRLGNGHFLRVDSSGLHISGPRGTTSYSDFQGSGIVCGSGDLITIDDPNLGTPEDWMWGSTGGSVLSFARTEDGRLGLRGRLSDGITSLGRALENAELQSAPPERLAWLEYSLAEALTIAGRLAEAEHHAAKSDSYARQSTDKHIQASCRSRLADVRNKRGQAALARQLFQEAEAIQNSIPGECGQLCSIRGYLYAQFLLDHADAALVEGRNRKILGTPLPAVQALDYAVSGLGLSQALRVQGKHEEAAKTLDTTFVWLSRARRADYLCLGLLERARLQIAQQRLDEAIRDLEQVSGLVTNWEFGLLEIDVELCRAQIAVKRNDLTRAREAIRAAEAVMKELGTTQGTPALTELKRRLDDRARPEGST